MNKVIKFFIPSIDSLKKLVGQVAEILRIYERVYDEESEKALETHQACVEKCDVAGSMAASLEKTLK